jgi:hypothetical protein
VPIKASQTQERHDRESYRNRGDEDAQKRPQRSLARVVALSGRSKHRGQRESNHTVLLGERDLRTRVASATRRHVLN